MLGYAEKFSSRTAYMHVRAPMGFRKRKARLQTRQTERAPLCCVQYSIRVLLYALACSRARSRCSPTAVRQTFSLHLKSAKKEPVVSFGFAV